jgi:hypothetical protein
VHKKGWPKEKRSPGLASFEVTRIVGSVTGLKDHKRNVTLEIDRLVMEKESRKLQPSAESLAPKRTFKIIKS